jgi:hypothetical protein
MNEDNVIVLHDVKDEDVSIDLFVDGPHRGAWLISILVGNEQTRKIYHRGVFKIPQVAESVVIDFDEHTSSYGLTPFYGHGDETFDIPWDEAKIS